MLGDAEVRLTNGEMLDLILMPALGLLITLFGFRFFQRKKGTDATPVDPRAEKLEKRLRILGPIILVCGMARAVAKFMIGP